MAFVARPTSYISLNVPAAPPKPSGTFKTDCFGTTAVQSVPVALASQDGRCSAALGSTITALFLRSGRGSGDVLSSTAVAMDPETSVTTILEPIRLRLSVDLTIILVNNIIIIIIVIIIIIISIIIVPVSFTHNRIL